MQDSGDFPFRPEAGGKGLPAPHEIAKVALPPLPPCGKPVEQGALVMQDTGGPVMLLSALSRDLAYCVWFSEAAQVCSGTFMVNRLVNVDDVRRRPVTLAVPVDARA